VVLKAERQMNHTKIFFACFCSFLEFLSGGIIRRISCNFMNNWLKCCVHKLLANQFPAPKKRENIEQSKRVAKRRLQFGMWSRFVDYCATEE
jgi:hypothetical protein